MVEMNETRWLVVVYQQSTDTTAIAALEEYLSIGAAEKSIQWHLLGGVDKDNIRVFQATECNVSVKEVSIQDGQR